MAKVIANSQGKVVVANNKALQAQDTVTISTDLVTDRASNDKASSPKSVFDALFKWGVVSQTISWVNNEYSLSDQVYGLIPKANIDLFETGGASFNDTGADITTTDWFGREFTHKAGCFALNGLGDISYNEMKIIYDFATIREFFFVGNTEQAKRLESTPARTNMWMSTSNWNTAHNFYSFAVYNGSSNLTSVVLRRNNTEVYVGAAKQFLYSANRVKYVFPTLNCSQLTGTGSAGNTFNSAFTNCYKLQEIRLKSIKINVSFSMSSELSLASVIFMVENAANTTAITITLHPTAYARCQSDTTEYTYNSQTYTGILAYASAKNITIASA